MTRMPRHAALLLGAIGALVIAAGIGVWLVSPSRIPVATGSAPAPAAPAAFNFTPHAAPRPLPELHFTDASSRQLSLADFRGRLVLLNLWATWCVPCRKEMPTLDRLQARLGGPGFEVVALSIDRKGLEAVQPFYQELGLKALRTYVDESGRAAREIDAPGVPTTLLIDREGREIGRVVGPAEWDSPQAEAVIRKYLPENAAELHH
ncbi:MAG TPA: TlpA disulfide reductase family protein [Stellaceae bacterium]|nr:TlpA disulfide reductase family protein [Stellaceae bacterium]